MEDYPRDLVEFEAWFATEEACPRRSSRRCGKLFYRLVQQAVAVEPTPYRSIVADWDAETL